MGMHGFTQFSRCGFKRPGKPNLSDQICRATPDNMAAEHFAIFFNNDKLDQAFIMTGSGRSVWTSRTGTSAVRGIGNVWRWAKAEA